MGFTFLYLFAVFVVQFSRCVLGGPLFAVLGGHKWIRTTDLTLIRRAL